jgi:hypothetical protein
VSAKREKIAFALPPDATEEGVAEELLWGEGMGDRWQVRNIPLLVDDVSFGDTVRTRNAHGRLSAEQVITRGGHSTIRITYLLGLDLGDLLDRLERLGCGVETDPHRGRLGIDIPPEVSYSVVADYLESLPYDAEDFVIEDACTQHEDAG